MHAYSGVFSFHLQMRPILHDLIPTAELIEHRCGNDTVEFRGVKDTAEFLENCKFEYLSKIENILTCVAGAETGSRILKN